MQDNRILRSHGYSLKGQRAKVKRRYSPWGPRITAIPVLSYNEGLLDVGLYEGHVNGKTFLDFVNDFTGKFDLVHFSFEYSWCPVGILRKLPPNTAALLDSLVLTSTDISLSNILTN